LASARLAACLPHLTTERGLIAGLQVICASFFLSIIGLARDPDPANWPPAGKLKA